MSVPALRRARGFTLIELLTVVAVLAILATSALPSFRRMLQANELTTAKNALVATLQRARSEAATSGRNAVLCPSQNGHSCQTAGDWSLGWLLYRDDNLNGRFDPLETLLVAHAQRASALSIRTSDGRRKVTYRGMGRADGANVRFVFCDPAVESGGQVVIANSGRIRTTDQTPAGACPQA